MTIVEKYGSQAMLVENAGLVSPTTSSLSYRVNAVFVDLLSRRKKNNTKL